VVTVLSKPTPPAFADTDEKLLHSLVSRRSGAWLAFYDSFAPYVLSVLRKLMGHDRDLDDLLQEVFARALENIEQVRDPSKLKFWLRSLAVFTAQSTLKRRRWLNWLPLGNREDSDDVDVAPFPATTDALAERMLLRRVQTILDHMSVNDRVPFCLRVLEGLELTEVAEACGVSLSTAKRRIAQAESDFHRRAANDPELRELMSDGRSVQS
jgi:RNA polymerase sigma-70 factor (ECF subfamily)